MKPEERTILTNIDIFLNELLDADTTEEAYRR